MKNFIANLRENHTRLYDAAIFALSAVVGIFGAIVFTAIL